MAIRSKRLPIPGPIDFVDFFSGCGGMSYGFERIGQTTGYYRWVGAFDIDKYANQTYLHNFGRMPSAIDLSGDVFAKVNRVIRRNGHQGSAPLLAIGCAPCQGFSSHKKKDKRLDDRNSLVARFAEMAVALNPVMILMENVPDLLARKHWHHFVRFREIVEGAGYKINADIVNMAEYGVPQERFRAVVLASRDFEPLLPLALVPRAQFQTVREAIGHLPPLSPFGGADPNDAMHRTSRHRQETVEIIKQIPKDGGSRPRGVGPKCLDKVNGFYDVYGRLWWDRPAITITARCRTPSCGRFVHPSQDRGLSIREAALLQGFPHDFYFSGPFDDCYKQIGNAVPPPFSVAMANHLRSFLLGENAHGRVGKVSFQNPGFESYSVLIAHHKIQHLSRRLGR